MLSYSKLEINFENFIYAIQKLIFFQTDILQENFEDILGIEVHLQEKTWKDVFKELISKANDLKQDFVEKTNNLLSQHSQEMDHATKKTIELESNYVSELKNLKEKLAMAEEKVDLIITYKYSKEIHGIFLRVTKT